MKRLFYALIMLIMTMNASAIKKNNVSVLYVGGSSNYDLGMASLDEASLKADISARKASFMALLNKYFTRVKCIDASEYEASMSDGFDVTIIDGTPKKLKDEWIENDEKGNPVAYHKAQYLPDNFNRAVITIADATDNMGRSLGSKLDWYCLCLSGYAHSTNFDHPIFKGPYKVKPKMEMRKTPAEAKTYTYLCDEPLPETMPMWSVQTKDYENTPGYRIGLVSREDGFFDSPDVEFISGGVSSKSIGAVAIGRHGNFFSWGFAASPTDMTEAGRMAFVNAVVYMKQFNGQTPIARKFNDAIATRNHARFMKYVFSNDFYNEYVETVKKTQTFLNNMRDSLTEVKKNGGVLTESQEAIMQMPRQQIPSRAQILSQYGGSLYKTFGDDKEAVNEYLDKNIDYLYPDANPFNVNIDTDAKLLGIANNNKQLLNKAIGMLERGEDTDVANRILTRYTLCRFTSPQEWRAWYDKYQDKLFFTESGGWLFLVNSREKDVVGNDYSVLKKEKEAQVNAAIPAPEQPKQASPMAQPSKTTPVVLDANAETLPDGNKAIVITSNIFTGFHIYAKVAETDPFIETKISIELPEGYETDGAMQLPSVMLLNKESKTTVYSGENSFVQKIKGNGNGTAKITIEYQCCDDSVCYPPQTETLEVKL